jgi:hypothetical protein
VNKLLEEVNILVQWLACLVHILKVLHLMPCETQLSANCLSTLQFSISTGVFVTILACKVHSKGNEVLVSQNFDREIKYIELSGVGEKGVNIIADWCIVYKSSDTYMQAGTKHRRRVYC